jgi:hypothetical protein
MYSTCLFCHADLGRNEELEIFPVGARLAFDAAKGRLWVVCRRCERWNLTPLEERWEAIEECERRFRGTRLRVSTDNIGLARLASGLELVRVGKALRPELAAWRYGDQFGRRRRKHVIITGAAVAAGFGFVVIGPMTGLIAGGSWGVFNIVNTFHAMYQERRIRARLQVPQESVPVLLRRKHLARARLIPGPSPSEWLLRVAYEREPREGGIPREVELSGDAALRAAGQILPNINERGARREQVATAVRRLEEHPDPAALFGAITHLSPQRFGPGALLDSLPVEQRLALEMAAHEDTERRAMEGELALLEAAWRAAEEIAEIADGELTPLPRVETRLQ